MFPPNPNLGSDKMYYFYIAQSYLALENYQQAKSYFAKMLVFNEENTDVLFVLGKISNILEEYHEAEKYLIESIYCNYKTKDLLFQLGLDFGGQKKYLQSLEAFKEATTYSNDDPILNYQIGVVYQELEIYDLAITEFEK